MGRRDVAFGRVQFRPEGLRAGLFCARCSALTRRVPSRAWMCFPRTLGKSANPAFPLARAPTIGDPDGERRDAGDGVGGEAECVFAQAYRLCYVFRGESVGGCAPPNLRQGDSSSWTLFIWVAAWVRFTRRRGLRRSEDLTGLRSFCACHAFLSECLAFGSRLLFAACAPNRTACGMFRSYSAVGRDRHSRVLGCRVVIGLCWFTSGLRVSLWRSRRRTKGRGNAENGGNGERSRRRGRVRFCVTALAL